jgi:membrane protein DedA with SNARE-associated domain
LLVAIAEWPPALVYLLIFVSCAIENVFPPSPSDVFVAVAAFLSHRGHYDPVAIGVIAWLGGMTGAAIVYAVARRHAERLLRSGVGQALLPPDALGFLRREYGRYGALGMFFTRLLPGFRSVVAPFAGLSGLGLGQTLVPIGAALLLWYAALTAIGARLGSEWDLVVRVLNGLNRGLGLVALGGLVVLLGGLGVWWKRRRRQA